MTSQQRQQQGLAGPQPITPELPSDLPPQPSEHPIPGNTNLHGGDGGNPYSDGHLETSPDVRAVASSGQAAVEGSPSLGNEAGLSASVASRHTNRSRPANDVGVGEGTPRAASVEEEIKRKPTTAKEECAFSFKPTPFRLVHFSYNKNEVIDTDTWTHIDGVGRKLSKIEKRGARVEKVALDIALQELAEIQGLQEASIKVLLLLIQFRVPSSHNLFPFFFFLVTARKKLCPTRFTPAR
jgi:hypothetical protein